MALVACVDELQNKSEQTKMIRVIFKPEYEDYRFSEQFRDDPEDAFETISGTRKIIYLSGKEIHSQLDGFLHLEDAVLHFDKPMSPQYPKTIEYNFKYVDVAIDTIKMIFREK